MFHQREIREEARQIRQWSGKVVAISNSWRIRQMVTALTSPLGHYHLSERSPHFLTLLQLLLARGAAIALPCPHICLKITS